MTMTENVVAEAKSDAMKWAADARGWVGETLAPEELFREAARALGSPGAATAAAILASTGLPPVPLGDALAPSAAPLSTFQAVYEHFRARHHDGLGLELGERPTGVVLVAQRCTASAWQAWQRAEGVAVHRRVPRRGRRGSGPRVWRCTAGSTSTAPPSRS